MSTVTTLEADRLNALLGLSLLDTPPEERFDRLTRIAIAVFGTAISTVTLIDADRQWHKACIGVGTREDDRAVSFCSVAIEKPEPLLVTDATEDPRFAGNPLVTGPPGIRSYAGILLTTAAGFRVGTLCVIDTRPREGSAGEVALLRDLARIAEDELNHKELSDGLASWREREQRFRAIFYDTAIGMTTVDIGGRIIDANRAFAAMMQIPVAELRGVPINAITHPADREDVDAEPLTSIRGSLGLLEAGVAGELPGEAADMVRIARENTERLTRLVEETLDLERLHAGSVELEVRSVTSAQLLASAAQVVQPLADAAGVELTWEAPGDLELFVDPDRIVQALVNLVGNAIKFSPRDATIRTMVKAHGANVLLSVMDEGRGIPAEQLEVYDRRAPRREQLARAVRRLGRRVTTFADLDELAEADGFALVLVAGAGLDDADPGIPVIQVDVENLDSSVAEALN